MQNMQGVFGLTDVPHLYDFREYVRGPEVASRLGWDKTTISTCIPGYTYIVKDICNKLEQLVHKQCTVKRVRVRVQPRSTWEDTSLDSTEYQYRAVLHFPSDGKSTTIVNFTKFLSQSERGSKVASLAIQPGDVGVKSPERYCAQVPPLVAVD
jgi:hypothetical protein